MTKNEEIKKVIFGLQFLKKKLYNGIFSDRLDCIDYAISAIKELQMYKDNKLCLVPEDVYSRQCCELDAYKEIGTVEECREAVEKQKPKELVYESDSVFSNGFSHYRMGKCPMCDRYYNSSDEVNYCSKCGQALMNENLEGMEDESSAI